MYVTLTETGPAVMVKRVCVAVMSEETVLAVV